MPHTPLPRAILLDMDDTVLVFTAAVREGWMKTCSSIVPGVSGLTAQTLNDAIRDHSFTFWDDPERHLRGRLNPAWALESIVSQALQSFGVESGSLAREIAETFVSERDQAIHPVPGAIETLQALRARGVRLGLVTNGDAEMQRGKIERTGIGPLFDHVLIEGEFGLGKPDPRVYLHALAALDTAAAQAWMVGDNLEWEVSAPQSLGLFAVWIDVRGRGLPPGSPVTPDRIIRSLPELLPAD